MCLGYSLDILVGPDLHGLRNWTGGVIVQPGRFQNRRLRSQMSV